jgi:hypothetical protein
MDDTAVQINFDAPAVLRKWPSLGNERVSASLGARPYMIIDGTLDECIRRFMLQPKSQHHLYEIHTAAQQTLVSVVSSAEQIVELARLSKRGQWRPVVG